MLDTRMASLHVLNFNVKGARIADEAAVQEYHLGPRTHLSTDCLVCSRFRMQILSDTATTQRGERAKDFLSCR